MHNHFLKLNINKTDVMEISLYPSPVFLKPWVAKAMWAGHEGL